MPRIKPGLYLLRFFPTAAKRGEFSLNATIFLFYVRFLAMPLSLTLKGGLSLEKFSFSDAGQFCDSVCFEYMNILALKYFLFEIERTFGSEVMVNLLKGVS